MRIGTRGSALALAQARWVGSQLSELGVAAEIVTVVTSGDRGEGVGDKERWVSELERALLAGEIDLAVHSAKDVPAEVADGTELVAFPAREDASDALCGVASLDALADGARVGTSSLRRAAQLRALRPGIEIVELRGNVDTRLRKLAAGDADAVVLAAAGLIRLGRSDEMGVRLDGLVPAAGQGALALQCRAQDPLGAVAAALDDPSVAIAVRAEREVVARLGASCHTAVGVHAVALADGERLELEAWVGLPDGSEWVSDRLAGEAREVGGAVAERLLAAGAGELLARATQGVAP